MTVSESNGHDGREGRRAMPTFRRRRRSLTLPIYYASRAARAVPDTRHFRRVTKPRFIVSGCQATACSNYIAVRAGTCPARR